ncbi:hypothetical protein EK904_004790, partial [Melospiza melodia maxima]
GDGTRAVPLGTPLPHGGLCSSPLAHSRGESLLRAPFCPKPDPACPTAGMNQTQVTEFVLLGFSHGRPFLFALFLAIYLATLLGNSVILSLVSLDRRLHSPMYFFLGHLSCLDLCYSSVTVPKILANALCPRATISYRGCLAQMFLLMWCAGAECALLALMAYDRFAAVRRKAFSTCSAHLIVVTLYFVAANLNYNRPSSGYSPAADTLVSVLYCIVIPMLNPLVYSLRNREVWGALRKALRVGATPGSPGSNA